MPDLCEQLGMPPLNIDEKPLFDLNTLAKAVRDAKAQEDAAFKAVTSARDAQREASRVRCEAESAFEQAAKLATDRKD